MPEFNGSAGERGIRAGAIELEETRENEHKESAIEAN